MVVLAVALLDVPVGAQDMGTGCLWGLWGSPTKTTGLRGTPALPAAGGVSILRCTELCQVSAIPQDLVSLAAVGAGCACGTEPVAPRGHSPGSLWPNAKQGAVREERDQPHGGLGSRLPAPFPPGILLAPSWHPPATCPQHALTRARARLPPHPASPALLPAPGITMPRPPHRAMAMATSHGHPAARTPPLCSPHGDSSGWRMQPHQ